MNPAPQTMTMRDAFLGRLHAAMAGDERIFIVTDDFGAPTLDRIRADFPDRYINVGIAEQNAINVATGLALEGHVSYAYGIAGFMTMRCYEQIRTNLSMAAELRALNANIVGVGAGVGYDLSGPSHHCLEDITLMRLLPNLEVFSPSDWLLTGEIAAYTVRSQHPKYIRLDSKPLPALYRPAALPRIETGFHEFAAGKTACIVATGYMTHVALRAAAQSSEPVGVIDLFAFRPLSEKLLFQTLSRYRRVVTVEEGFIHRGGLDAMITQLLTHGGATTRVRALGVNDRYLFDVGNRAHLHKLCAMDEPAILDALTRPD
jgi:transketolase